MKRPVKIAYTLLACISAIWVTGITSNYFVATRVEKAEQQRIETVYARFRQSWLTPGPRQNRPHRPKFLPEHPQWLAAKQIALAYRDADHYELPVNNKRGFISVPRPSFLRYGWYEPTEGSIPWAFIARRTIWVPFYVKIESAYQIGPLAGYGGYLWYVSVFGWQIKNGGGIYWLS